MLTCYSHSIRLPRSNLAYLAFRLAVQETVSDIELHLDLEEEPDPPCGYLIEVPFLEQVALPVQVDLLSETWARHRTGDRVEASLLDAAVVYGVCRTAARVIDDMPEVAAAMIRGGPRDLNSRVLRRASARLDDLFERFWDDRDFLLIDEWQDLPPDQAACVKTLMRLPDELLEPMYEALERWRVSPAVGANLEGLLSKAEIQETVPLLEAWVSRRWTREPEAEDDEAAMVIGIEDRHHALFVGPCDPEVAAAEADCPLVDEISISSDDAFDCSYEEWRLHFGEDVRQAAQKKQSETPTVEETEVCVDVAERLHRAQTTGLEDGTRIEARGAGFVVVDEFQSFLFDPDDATWVAGEDDEDMPPAMFPTAEAALKAWERSQEVAQARTRRRKGALKRLGKS